MGPGFAGTTTNLQIVLNIPPPPPKMPSQLEPPKITPESKISNPQKTFDHLRHLNSDFPSPPPLGLSLALTEHRGNLAMAYWNEKTLGTRKRTKDVINFRPFKQTNKKPRNYFSRRINDHRK